MEKKVRKCKNAQGDGGKELKSARKVKNQENLRAVILVHGECSCCLLPV